MQVVEKMRKTVLYRTVPLWSLLLAKQLLAAQAGGVVAPYNPTTLGVVESGVVAEVLVREGDRVKQGSLLLRLDPSVATARMEASEALLKARQLEQEEAQRELERAKELYDRTQLSDHDKQVAEVKAAVAEAALKQAQLEQRQALQRLAWSEIKAPFDALVLQRLVQPGQALANGDRVEPLLRVAEQGRMSALLTLKGAQLSGLAQGVEVRVDVAGRQLTGRVDNIHWLKREGSDPEPIYEVRVSFAVQGSDNIREGMSAAVSW